MQRKSVTEERAEVWKANERREVIVKKKGDVRISEFFYVANIFVGGLNLTTWSLTSIVVAMFCFFGAALARDMMFQELRGNL